MIVGREHELEVLRGFIRGEDGGAVLALIQGEAGIGKTALWTSAVEDARDDGAAVLVARPTASETASSYAALADLLHPVLHLFPRVPDLPRHALAAALLLEPSAGRPDMRAVALGLLAVLDEVGRTIVAVDDWQWLDEPTTRVLSFAVRRLPAEVRMLATVRTGVSDEPLALLVRGLPARAVLQLPIGELHGEPLRRIVEEQVGVPVTRSTLARLEAASAGNPLMAIEVARAEHSRGPVDVTDVRRLLAARVAALSAPGRDALRATAALAAPTAALVERAAEDPAAARRGVEQALAADLLRQDGARLRFAHPLIAVAVEERTPVPAWRALHRRLARVVEDVEERARHLAEAADGPDAATADALEEAAEHAAVRGATGVMAELVERAAQLTPEGDGEAWFRRRLAAGDAYAVAGDWDSARRILDELALGLPAGPDRARALYRRAMLAFDASARDLAVQALAEAGDDDRLLAEIEVTVAHALHLRDGSRAGIVHAGRALWHAERCGDAPLRAWAMAELALHRFAAGHGVQREMLVAAARLEPVAGLRAGVQRARTTLIFQLGLSDGFDEARTLAASEIARATAEGNTDLEVSVLAVAVESELRAGRTAAATEYSQRLDDLCRGTDEETTSNCLRALVDGHLGRTESAAHAARLALDVAEPAEDRVTTVRARHALGLLDLARGDGPGAAGWLAPTPAHESALGVEELRLFQLHADVAEALVLAGDLEAAAAAAATLELAGDNAWTAGTALRCRGLIHAAAGHHAEAIADHRSALERLAGALQPIELARTLLALGTAQRRAKQRAAARESLEAALAAFAALGAALWGERAEGEIARLGGRRTADRDELTQTERQIAELAAAGRSNRDIAAALFVSERTVEANLTRAYRKLGVRSRTELARRFPA